MPTTTKTKARPTRIKYLQGLIAHERTSPEERAAAERALTRVLAAQKAADDEGEKRGGGWASLPIWYGQKYDGRLSTTEIAALIRQDIKLARKLAAKAGPDDGPGTVKLPNAIGDAPAGVKFSVRREYFSGGSAVRMTVKVPDAEWAWTIKDDRGYPRKVATEPMNALADELRALANAYNFDGSDIATDYFHVNYYLSLDVEAPDGSRLCL
ncbi:hypothetical protein [Streptomyces sp. NRRL B-24484]|uniref:hypothetical protein n=1 Tax=Streptomyces sp. NRRL B-24484 TaxID=1463833 RepID=UPI000693D85A|nr:hypothetical protein [Streptomyces sp. NRRL B-24484]